MIEMGKTSAILVSSVMEETGGLGVDVVVDNGGMDRISIVVFKSLIV